MKRIVMLGKGGVLAGEDAGTKRSMGRELVSQQVEQLGLTEKINKGGCAAYCRRARNSGMSCVKKLVVIVNGRLAALSRL